MNRSIYKYPASLLQGLLTAFLLFTISCKPHVPERVQFEEKRKEDAVKAKALLKSIQGIRYTEVKRTFDNGLSFSAVGYQLVPEWRISFPSTDSVNIYSPRKHRFLNTPVIFDHDSVYNVAWAWLKLKYIKKDSIQFMVLHVHDNVIQEEKTHVYMTFYTNDYIKNVLHADTANMLKPSRKDTNFIKAKILKAHNTIDSAFAGTEPAILKARSPLISIKKEITPEGDVDGGMSFDDYLSPTYNITIKKAYDNFNYIFTAYVDEKGILVFRKANQAMYPEFKVATLAAMTGITDGYLKLYMDVTPAKTLGIPHNSIVILNVTGIKK
ncbi:hypothetical protein [Mucilaginibacter xinganensis]|uniref:Uncharacterized protein n=1 Tax=Mucilaginibacter xinganensis TaxID=1234841 RepID=A0A223P2E5_9SPHI|nr:hypothetical protein [Mucilaginibacter xinganensis]ASU36319.1 hypothetical protein MuYL_4434 [Mucilaginibacter xinganensis]